jgi:hypothetical protein
MALDAHAQSAGGMRLAAAQNPAGGLTVRAAADTIGRNDEDANACAGPGDHPQGQDD